MEPKKSKSWVPKRKQRLYIKIICKDLPYQDSFTKRVDPLVAVFIKQPNNNHYKYFAQTEWQRNVINPEFKRPIIIYMPVTNEDMSEEEINKYDAIKVRFSAYDVDNAKTLKREDLIGDTIMSLSTLVQSSKSKHQVLFPLRKKYREESSHIPQQIEEMISLASSQPVSTPTLQLEVILLQPNDPLPNSLNRNSLCDGDRPLDIRIAVHCKNLPIFLREAGNKKKLKLHRSNSGINFKKKSISDRRMTPGVKNSTTITIPFTPGEKTSTLSKVDETKADSDIEVNTDDTHIIPEGDSWCCVFFSKTEDRQKFKVLGYTEYYKSCGRANQNDAAWSRVTSFVHVQKLDYQRCDLRFAVYCIRSPDSEASHQENKYTLVGDYIVDLHTLLTSQPYYSAKINLSNELDQRVKSNKHTTLLIYARMKEKNKLTRMPFRNPSQLQGHGAMEGYLLKRSAYRKNWSRRYFILENGIMKYWKNELDQISSDKPVKPNGVFAINEAHVKLKLSLTEQLNRQGNGSSGLFTIRPKGNDRAVHLFVDDATTAVHWLDAIKINGGIVEPTEQM